MPAGLLTTNEQADKHHIHSFVFSPCLTRYAPLHILSLTSPTTLLFFELYCILDYS
jgi:hypothetical protein